jgi:hypothetical protein
MKTVPGSPRKSRPEISYLKVAVAVLFAIMEKMQVPVVVEPEVTEQLAFVTFGAEPPQPVKV